MTTSEPPGGPEAWVPRAVMSDASLDSMNFLNEVVERFPDAISFGPGRPLERLFDVGSSWSRISDYLASVGSTADRDRILGQYGETNGFIRGAPSAITSATSTRIT